MVARNSRECQGLVVLIAIGIAGLALYAVLARLGNLLVRPFAFIAVFVALLALYALACWLVLRDDSTRLPRRWALPTIAAFALAYRLTLMPTVPSLSDDFFRYVWEGFIQGRGYSPYRYPPQAAELVSLRDDYFWSRINRKEQTTAYPPLAQLTFQALATIKPFNATVFKLGFVALDLATVALLATLLQLRGRPPTAAIIYAWHPLPIVEFAGSGHFDALAILLIVAALVFEQRRWHAAAGVALGLATLTKLYPGLLLPAFTRRERWQTPVACVATVVVGFAPALLTGDTNFRQFPTYLSEEGYQSGERFFPRLLLDTILHIHIPATAYIVVAGTTLAALALWLIFGPVAPGPLDLPPRALLLAGASLLLVTPGYPWYFIWLLPLLAFIPVAGLWYLASAIAFVYLGLNWQGASRPPLLPFLAAVYVPAWALLVGRDELQGDLSRLIARVPLRRST